MRALRSPLSLSPIVRLRLHNALALMQGIAYMLEMAVRAFGNKALLIAAGAEIGSAFIFCFKKIVEALFKREQIL